MEMAIHFFQDSLMNRKNSAKEEHLFEKEIFCNIINVCIVTFDQLNASLLNYSNFFLLILNGSVSSDTIKKLRFIVHPCLTHQGL